jgi:hypothetical protein
MMPRVLFRLTDDFHRCPAHRSVGGHADHPQPYDRTRWRRSVSRWVWISGALFLLGAVSGCGGGSTTATTTTTVTRAASVLSGIVPAKSLAKYPAGSPQRVVLSIWRYGELGDEQAVVANYHPKVLAALGGTTIAAAYDLQRSYLVDTAPQILGVDKTRQGDLVSVEETPKVGQPLLDTFLLRQVKGSWVVTYDTFLERALQYYVQQQIQPVPTARPSTKAVLAGQAEATAYRNVFLTGPAPQATTQTTTQTTTKP